MDKSTHPRSRSSNHVFALRVCATSAVALMTSAAWAQQIQPSGGQAPGLEEVVVTATKRSTPLQETPISITAVTGEELIDRGIGNFTNLAQETPGISMKTNGPGQTEFEMRGLDSYGGSSPTVGFYIDDVPLSPPALGFVGKTVVDPNLYDLNRVEVLRGPQGTLYGAGSMGGTIKLITNQPDTTGHHCGAETILSGTDGGGFNHTENAMANIPLIDNKLAVRAVLTESGISGWIDRIVVSPFPVATMSNGVPVRGNVVAAPAQKDHQGVNSTEAHGARISALYTPTNRLTIGTTFFTQRIAQGGANSFDTSPGINYGDILAHYEAFDVKEPYVDSFTMWTVNANYKFDDFDVVSVSSNWSRRGSTRQDGTEVLGTYLGLSSYGTPATGGEGVIDWLTVDKTRQLSEELRVASTGNGPLQWLAGLFYSGFHSTFHQEAYNSAMADLRNPVPAILGSNDPYLITAQQPATIQQKAVFGEVTYTVVDALKMTVGARYFEYNSKIPTSENGAFYGGENQISFAQGKDHGLDPKFNISYDVGKDLMLYGTAERGFRPGGGNVPVAANSPIGQACAEAFKTTPQPDTYRPDTVWSYEVGEKYKLGNSLTIDGALYHERWAGVQQTISLPCGDLFIANAGTAVVNGGELETKWFATRNLLLSGTYGYSQSILTENVPNAGEFKGQRTLDTPLMTASGALTYFFDVNADWQASIRGSYDWTDGLAENKVLTPTGRIPAHGFANLRATMFNDRWTVAAFIDNLTNKHAEMEAAATIVAPIPTLYRMVTNQPRTAGIDVNIKF